MTPPKIHLAQASLWSRATYQYLLLDFVRTIPDETIGKEQYLLRSQLTPYLDQTIRAAENWPSKPWIAASFLRRALDLVAGQPGLRRLREELEFALEEFDQTDDVAAPNPAESQ